ncbi:Interferon-induced GTP-binding protein Mx [Ceratocystis platani]|uniref:Interferon-induced GTP-binding protein Mx n=1 Tax=Ceratocystis fimbriata f. sp. platani TaxID=88771 RepID=A0A0F8BW58_CERFI|nr:Interferon-induced GTP-binding protein Mx [Ceratocystis platani]
MTRIIDSTLNTHGLADDQRGLLELIDKLQFAQLDNVKLPQIVVVGDQSAGKSSVLEALTGTPFPRDSGACTRFATEIRMRRAKESTLKVTIIPDRSRPQSEQLRLLQYGGHVNENTPFESLMRDAGDLIAPKGIPGRFAARDILVVEKRGPDMPLLTLVDLPGLVRVANRDQSESDIRTIEALSDRYMKSSRTIILAVIGGNNDYVQAPILRKARQFDPSGSRSIGVLTKPDLTEGIGLEDKFIELVMNEDAENHFKLGWYVLLNPGPPLHGEAWPSPAERQRREDEFFSRGKWSTLPASMRGVGALRQKLSTQLQKHIGRHIPSLRKQIQDALSRCDHELKQLGEGKDTVEEMKLEMGELFSTSNNLVTPAINGNYKNPPGEKFFPRQAISKGTPPQRLRARVREESERFARRFRDSARKVKFSDTTGASGVSSTLNGLGSQSKKDFARSHVEPLLAQVRGTELPMDSNPRAPYILFQDYAQNWPTISTEFKDNIVVICNEFLSEIIDYVWPQRMHSPLREHYLEPMMADLVKQAEKELVRLTEDMELEIQPFDPEYEERLKKWRHQATQEGQTYTEAEEVLEKMLIYYDCTARIFIRNVITQIAERYLILGLLRLFNPVKILQMSNAVVEAIAAENKQTRDRRITLKNQKHAIEEAKTLCANLAMRSDLRSAYEDDYGEDSEDETVIRRRPTAATQNNGTSLRDQETIVKSQHDLRQLEAAKQAALQYQQQQQILASEQAAALKAQQQGSPQRSSHSHSHRNGTHYYKENDGDPSVSSSRSKSRNDPPVSGDWEHYKRTSSGSEGPDVPSTPPPPPPPRPPYHLEDQASAMPRREPRPYVTRR